MVHCHRRHSSSTLSHLNREREREREEYLVQWFCIRNIDNAGQKRETEKGGEGGGAIERGRERDLGRIV